MENYTSVLTTSNIYLSKKEGSQIVFIIVSWHGEIRSCHGISFVISLRSSSNLVQLVCHSHFVLCILFHIWKMYCVQGIFRFLIPIVFYANEGGLVHQNTTV